MNSYKVNSIENHKLSLEFQVFRIWLMFVTEFLAGKM